MFALLILKKEIKTMKRITYVLVCVLCVIMVSNQAIAIPLLRTEVPS